MYFIIWIGFLSRMYIVAMRWAILFLKIDKIYLSLFYKYQDSLLSVKIKSNKYKWTVLYRMSYEQFRLEAWKSLLTIIQRITLFLLKNSIKSYATTIEKLDDLVSISRNLKRSDSLETCMNVKFTLSRSKSNIAFWFYDCSWPKKLSLDRNA